MPPRPTYKQLMNPITREIDSTAILRVDDNTSLPLPQPGSNDPFHPLYIQYLADVAAGATVLPADLPPPAYTGAQWINPSGDKVITQGANGGTPLVVAEWTLAANTEYRATFEVDCIDMTGDAGTGKIYSAEALVKVYRLAGNAAILAQKFLNGGPDSNFVSPPGGFGIAGGVTGQKFQVIVTGIANRTLHWFITGKFITISPTRLN